MIARWCGRLAGAAGVAAWMVWIGWRVASPVHGVVGIAVLVLEVLALVASVVITAGLWNLTPSARAAAAEHRAEHRADRRDEPSVVTLPERLSTLLGVALPAPPVRGSDDTGEVACARQGLGVLARQRSSSASAARSSARSLAELTWAVVAVEGMRRMMAVAALIAVLLLGHVPFDTPPVEVVVALLAAQVLVAVGHWLLSGGAIRPGDRMRWSMASVGAGFGDGISRSGLPIRWATTMATIVVLNLAVSLRGVSDRWTHGLGPLDHDERVVAMTVSCWLVVVGFAALRTLPRPNLGLYGATRRLEETSTRRLALGATLAVALVGFVAGVLPDPSPFS